jgi:hypothetical protein
MNDGRYVERQARMQGSLEIMHRLFAGEKLTSSGGHYTAETAKLCSPSFGGSMRGLAWWRYSARAIRLPSQCTPNMRVAARFAAHHDAVPYFVPEALRDRCTGWLGWSVAGIGVPQAEVGRLLGHPSVGRHPASAAARRVRSTEIEILFYAGWCTPQVTGGGDALPGQRRSSSRRGCAMQRRSPSYHGTSVIALFVIDRDGTSPAI